MFVPEAVNRCAQQVITSAHLIISAVTTNVLDQDYEFLSVSIAASISGKIKSQNDILVTLPFERFDHQDHIEEVACYYQQNEIPLPGSGQFETGMWLDYGQGAGACGRSSENNDVIIEIFIDIYGSQMVTIKSTLRTIEVTGFSDDTLYEYTNFEEAQRQFLDNAIKAKMGFACK